MPSSTWGDIIIDQQQKFILFFDPFGIVDCIYPLPRLHNVHCKKSLARESLVSDIPVAICFYMHRMNRIPAHKFQVWTYLMLPEI